MVEALNGFLGNDLFMLHAACIELDASLIHAG